MLRVVYVLHEAKVIGKGVFLSDQFIYLEESRQVLRHSSPLSGLKQKQQPFC